MTDSFVYLSRRSLSSIHGISRRPSTCRTRSTPKPFIPQSRCLWNLNQARKRIAKKKSDDLKSRAGHLVIRVELDWETFAIQGDTVKAVWRQVLLPGGSIVAHQTAHKLARIAWAVLSTGQDYRAAVPEANC